MDAGGNIIELIVAEESGTEFKRLGQRDCCGVNLIGCSRGRCRLHESCIVRD